MRDLLILGGLWLAIFFAMTRAAQYPAVWAAVGASAATGFVGIYVFWVDWTLPMH